MSLTVNDQNALRYYLEKDTKYLLHDIGLSLSEQDPNVRHDIKMKALMAASDYYHVDPKYIEEQIDRSDRQSIYGGMFSVEHIRLLIAYAKSRIEDEKQLLKIAICENFKYCEKRKKGFLQDDRYSLAVGIADSLIAYYGTNIPIPVASLTAYLVKNELLDNLCGCG